MRVSAYANKTLFRNIWLIIEQQLLDIWIIIKAYRQVGSREVGMNTEEPLGNEFDG